MPSLRRRFYRSRFHHPALVAHAAYWQTRYRLSPLTRTEERPRFFGVGLFRTGTNSLVRMVAHHMRAAHEPHRYLFVRQWLRLQDGRITPEEWDRFLAKRDRVLGLSFESSGFLCGEVPRLVRLFPDARFLLTVREPISWARSLLREIVLNRSRLGYHYYEPMFRKWFGTGSFPREETDLERKNLFPLRGMFAYWAEMQIAAIEAAPPENLLVVQTAEISDRIPLLERFFGLPDGGIDRSATHSHQSKETWDPLESVPAEYLEARSQEFASMVRRRIESISATAGSGGSES